MNDILYRYRKTDSTLFSAPMDQSGSSCCHNFVTVVLRYHSKVNPIGALHAWEIYEAVLLCVFKIAFPASLLPELVLTYYNLFSPSCNIFVYYFTHLGKAVCKGLKRQRLIGTAVAQFNYFNSHKANKFIISLIDN